VSGHFGKWHLGSVRSGSPINPGASGFDTWLSAPNFFDNDPILSREGTAVQTHGESSMVTVDAALDFIRQHADTDRPFLAVVWFGSPHGPHRALERDRALYANQSEKLQNFYGEITAMDRAFGKLRQELRDLGIHQDTLLWYCSDNGGLPEVGSTGGRGHKGQIYEGGLRVPAVLEWPREISEPRATDMPATTSDLYPTLLDIAGVRLAKQRPLDGMSLMPLVNGSMSTRPKPIGFWERPEEGVPVASDDLMAQLLEAQKHGSELGDLARLRLDAWKIEKDYPQGPYPGHAAWLDWPWKLH
jgi:arylsulfatase A-like enzyme